MNLVAFTGVCGVIGLLTTGILSAYADNPAKETLLGALSSILVPEIPAKAAKIVSAAPAADRDQVASEVLQAVSTIARPGVLPYVVSAICRKTPGTAGPAVATAIGLQPQDALIFTKAALMAAPGQADQVVLWATKAAPQLGTIIALASVQQIPTAGESIRTSLGNARPDLELYLEETELKLGTNDYQNIIKQAAQMYDDAARAHSR